MSSRLWYWTPLFSCLFDTGRGVVFAFIPYLVPGVDLKEWLSLSNQDYDDVDRLYIDGDTIGG